MIDLSIQEFISNPWFSLVTFFVGILHSIVLHNVSKKVKRLSYFVKTSRILRYDMVELAKQYDIFSSKRFDNISLTKVLIWNSGDVMIDGSEIAKKAPLHIHAAYDDTLIGYKVVQVKNPANGFTTSRDVDSFTDIKTKEPLTTIKVDFDYINPKEGVVIKLFHTCCTPPAYIYMTGAIKGLPQIEEYKLPEERPLLVEMIHRLPWAWGRIARGLMLTIIILILPIYFIILEIYTNQFAIFGLIIPLMYTLALWLIYSIEFGYQIPNGFEIMNERL